MEKIWLNQYPAGVPAEIDSTRYESLVQIFNESCQKYAHLPAFANLGHKITYKELAEFSLQFASYLQQLGLVTGERVAIMMPNLLQYPIALFGILQAGLIVVNVNPLYTVKEFTHQMNDAKPTTILVLANFAHIVSEALPDLPFLKNVIVTEVGDCLPWVKQHIVNLVVKRIKRMVPPWHIPQAVTFNEALAKGKQNKFEIVTVTRDNIAFLQYTGGTTGIVKGAILTHGNIVANLLQTNAWIRPFMQAGQEIIITPLPLYHIFSLVANCLNFIFFGSLNVLITNPRDIKNFIHELKSYPFTGITGVNTLFNALLNHSEFSSIDFSHLKITLGGGMAVQKTVAKRWQAVTGKPLSEAYGLTETSPAVTMNPLDSMEYNGSIGLPLPSTEVALLDENNQPVAIGELCVKGPQVMRGYWQNPEETAKVFTPDAWLRTGDVAKMDEKGFLYLVDRKKDMILVSGFNVYPNEVEEVIASHPAVLEVGVVGEPHPLSGEIVKAVIVKKPNAELNKETLLEFCREQLTGYKIPKIIEFRDSLPKTNVGKILRRELRNATYNVSH